MLIQRVITGLLLGSVVLFVTWLGGIWFQSLMALMAVAAFFEFARMKAITFGHVEMWFGLILTLLWNVLGFESIGNHPWMVGAIYVLLLLPVITKNQVSFLNISYILLGSIYVGLSLHYASLLRGLNNGGEAILFVLISIWITDTAAYFVGRSIKGPKIWPSISPNKTISGSIGGLLAALLAGAIFASTVKDITITDAMILAGCVSVAGQLGDLVESAIKRSMNVKDSGQLLPGHGGVLDRFDSFLFALPVAYYFFVS